MRVPGRRSQSVTRRDRTMFGTVRGNPPSTSDVAASSRKRLRPDRRYSPRSGEDCPRQRGDTPRPRPDPPTRAERPPELSRRPIPWPYGEPRLETGESCSRMCFDRSCAFTFGAELRKLIHSVFWESSSSPAGVPHTGPLPAPESRAQEYQNREEFQSACNHAER